jgi:hypothetical protein
MSRKRMTLAEARAAGFGPWLYRLYDAADVLLYVGVTDNLPRDRFNRHGRRHGWWPEVSTVDLEPHRAIWLALAAERAAIKAERPLYNKRSAVTV